MPSATRAGPTTIVTVVQTGQMTSAGVVRSFDADQGWGIIDGPDVPGGCWVHFSTIAADGFRALKPGQQVSFHAEPASQDGYAYRALKVWTDATEPPEPAPPEHRSSAYQSSLTLTFDPGPNQVRPD